MRVRKYVCERDREKERDREWVSVFLCLYWSIILFDLLYYLPIKAARPHEGFPTNQPIAKFILYADVANIIVTANTIEEVYNQIANLINNLEDWVHCNGLTLKL